MKLLTLSQKQILTKHFTKMWNEQTYPPSWKIIKAITFPKNNKENDNLKNYRIISLINVFSKLFSKTLKSKINEHIQINQLLAADSYGFREGVGVDEYCVRLVQILENNTSNKYISVVLTIDITNAFNKVNSNILYKKLKEMRFEDKYIYWIIEGLMKREIIIGNDIIGAEIKTSEGLPQGDVLSPILFNIYTNELHELKNNNIEILQYADDFTFVIRDTNATEVDTRASQLLRTLKHKLEYLNFTINPSKCKYMCVNMSPFCSSEIYLFDTKIERKDSVKILGVTFDEKITFNKHHNEKKEDIMKYINILKIFGNKTCGAHPKTLLNILNAIIKSRATYASPCLKIDNKKS